MPGLSTETFIGGRATALLPPLARHGRNRLLGGLSAADFGLLQPYLTPVRFAPGQSVEPPDQPIEHCCFLESGVVSVVAKTLGGRRAEVALVGPEGMIGVAVIMGDDRAAHETWVQIAGSGQRLPVARLRQAIDASRTLRRRLLQYAHTFLIQASHTALANGTARIAERVARSILMSQDRMGDTKIHLTHEVLSIALAVRRAGVTDALHELEGLGLIRSTRGRINILDRYGLIDFADGCYGAPEAEYERLMAG
jgi:CRP-like cAMP-binding protein